MKKIDINKPIRTVSSKTPVYIVTYFGRDPYPIVGYIGERTDLDTWNFKGENGTGEQTIENYEPPVMVQLEAKDILPFSLLKHKDYTDDQWGLITDYTHNGVYAWRKYLSYITLKNEGWLIKRPNENWKKCEKEKQ